MADKPEGDGGVVIDHGAPLSDEPDNIRPTFEPKEIVIDGEDKSEPSKAGASQEGAPAADIEGAAELRRQRDLANSRAEAATRAAAAERDRAIYAERNANAIGATMIDESIKAWANDRSQATAALETAMSQGDYKTAAGLQARISDSAVALADLQRQKQQVEFQSSQPRRETAVPQPEVLSSQLDGITKVLLRDGFQKSAEWLKSHPDLAADQRGVKRLGAAHDYAVDIKGLVPETPAYFEMMERELGITKADPEPEEAPTRRTERAAPTRAAPTTSSAPTLSGRSQRIAVTLSPSQRETAEIMGMTDEEYAKSLLAAERDPRYRPGGGGR